MSDWEKSIEQAKANRGKMITPNNLPIRCIKYDWTMLEHEHGDHPTYIFPVEAEYVGSGPVDTLVGDDGREEPLPEAVEKALRTQDHALIYTDGYVAITLYENVYCMWGRRGEVKAGQMWKKGDWRLTEDSLKKIRDYAKEKFPDTDW